MLLIVEKFTFVLSPVNESELTETSLFPIEKMTLVNVAFRCVRAVAMLLVSEELTDVGFLSRGVLSMALFLTVDKCSFVCRITP